MYCHGWEETGTPTAGMLAVGEASKVAVVLHIARQVLRISDQVTLYTHGDKKLAGELSAALETHVPMTVDARRITKLVKSPLRSCVTIYFDDGTSRTEAFLAHKPSTKLRGSLAQQLGVELTPFGTIKVEGPFNQTSLRGVFAAGDCSTFMQTVTAALYSGTCAGGGAPSQLQAEALGQSAIF